MESNVVLQIILEENGGIEVHMGEASEEVSPVTLIGIVEQIKMTIFENMRVEKINRSNNLYDA